MTKITICGKGNMEQAIGNAFISVDNAVNYIDIGDPDDNIGDIVANWATKRSSNR